MMKSHCSSSEEEYRHRQSTMYGHTALHLPVRFEVYKQFVPLQNPPQEIHVGCYILYSHILIFGYNVLSDVITYALFLVLVCCWGGGTTRDCQHFCSTLSSSVQVLRQEDSLPHLLLRREL
jgi:hypothetical protein